MTQNIIRKLLCFVLRFSTSYGHLTSDCQNLITIWCSCLTTTYCLWRIKNNKNLYNWLHCRFPTSFLWVVSFSMSTSHLVCRIYFIQWLPSVHMLDPSVIKKLWRIRPTIFISHRIMHSKKRRRCLYHLLVSHLQSHILYPLLHFELYFCSFIKSASNCL